MSSTSVGESRVGGTQAIGRAALVLSTVIEADEPLSFGFIASECDLHRSTTSRILSALEHTDLLERSESGGYVAGPLFWLYASRHDPWEEIVRVSRPVLERIGEITRETVHLGVARNGRVAHMAQVDSSYLLGSRDWTDVEVPAHASALGKVLFAHDALPLPRERLRTLTDTTVGSLAALRSELAMIRDRGWSATVDELELGLTAVAVPVVGADGEVFASLGVSGPTTRLESRIEEVGNLLVTQSAELTAVLNGHTRKEGVA